MSALQLAFAAAVVAATVVAATDMVGMVVQALQRAVGPAARIAVAVAAAGQPSMPAASLLAALGLRATALGVAATEPREMGASMPSALVVAAAKVWRSWAVGEATGALAAALALAVAAAEAARREGKAHQ